MPEDYQQPAPTSHFAVLWVFPSTRVSLEQDSGGPLANPVQSLSPTDVAIPQLYVLELVVGRPEISVSVPLCSVSTYLGSRMNDYRRTSGTAAFHHLLPICQMLLILLSTLRRQERRSGLADDFLQGTRA